MNPTVVDRALRPPRADAARPILHGWPQHWYAWRKVIPLLGESHRLISPDLRGFGWTDAPRDGYSTTELADDLLALLDTLELDRVLVVDHERPPGAARLRARRARALARAPAVDAQRDTSILEREAAGAARLAVLVDGLRRDAAHRTDPAAAGPRLHEDAIAVPHPRPRNPVRGRG